MGNQFNARKVKAKGFANLIEDYSVINRLAAVDLVIGLF
jgi:hypothetical protein